MAKREKIVLDAAQKSIGRTMDALAATYSSDVAGLAMPEVDRLVKARQDWEGGAFAVMYKVTSQLPPQLLAALPDPKADSGMKPAHYWSVVIRDNKEVPKEHYWYEELVLNFPAIRDKGKRIDQLKRSMGDPLKVNQSDIGADIKNMSHDYRNGEIARLTKEISGAVQKVSNAFELYWQFQRMAELPHVTCYPIYRQGPDNKPMDGLDGRAFEVEPTQVPIVIKSTVAGREDIDKVQVSIGSFLRFDVDKAKEQGGTYQALIDTAKREKKTDEQGNGQANAQSATQLIRSTETALARVLDLYEFADFAWSEKDDKHIDGIRKALNGAGSNDAFTAVMGLKKFLEEVCPDSPRNTARYQELINADGTAKAA
jgi:hypothetical protein